MTPEERARAIHEVISVSESSQTRDNEQLVFTRPTLVKNADQEVIGIKVMVHHYIDGEDQKVDPVRVFINPPVGKLADRRVGFDIQTGKFLQPKIDEVPNEAFWDILWDSVHSTPNYEWRKK